jgi:5'-deoxynucleotidase YfbR-like HD superfamily hydrolase
MDRTQYPVAGMSPLPFLHVVERLKKLKRAGWERRGIQSPESVADHMYRMAWHGSDLHDVSGMPKKTNVDHRN